jgi:hypothetical protein
LVIRILNLFRISILGFRIFPSFILLRPQPLEGNTGQILNRHG